MLLTRHIRGEGGGYVVDQRKGTHVVVQNRFMLLSEEEVHIV